MQKYGISWNTMPIFRISSTISPVTGPPPTSTPRRLLCDWWRTTRLKLFNTRLNNAYLQPADDERSYHRCGCTIWSGVVSSTEEAAAAKSTLQR